MPSNSYAARTPEDLAFLSEQQGRVQVVLQLADVAKPPSRWTESHLVAYRLLRSPERPFLPILKAEHDGSCPVCKPEGNSSCYQELNRTKLANLVGHTPPELGNKPEGELMRLPNGFFWAALARAAHAGHPEAVRVQPRRERKQVVHENHVNSANAIPGSSPTVMTSSSEFEVDANDPDEDDYEARRNMPEEVTVHLIISFLQFALSLCLEQPGTEFEVRPRVGRLLTRTQIAGRFTITAVDDGGMAWHRRQGLGWEMHHPYLASIEAKRANRFIFDEKTRSYTPVISNETLAQYLGEAVITWKGNRDYVEDHFFIIAATSTYVCFLHFEFGRDYMEYLDLPNEALQKQKVQDNQKDTCVYVESTRFYNLQSPEGRLCALCHVLAIVRWHEVQQAQNEIVDDLMVVDSDGYSEVSAPDSS
ncbi:hypothetical protein QBC47DRAFT_465458 [Echria macrotheca]|uniref:Uncharacterized protein n=1 Tax=Echria macrotheca TaxID=438768 RepID=A0AAJ0B0V7_9PEZI|nr:hypothetical protein QBC47DRAFT_465458 [Echria macrotheca]